MEAVGAALRNVYLYGMVALSVLDLSPVTTATPPSAALRNSLDLARIIDRLGYTRLWLAEHHNLANIASSAPDIMIGQVAAITKNLRVGSGGVMLPNHAPLMVMERFKVLEALFPGRIDLGLGRAPEPEVDAAGEQRFQHLEALHHHQRRMVRQHHAAGADAQVLRDRRHLSDHDVGRRARDVRQVMVLGEPQPRVAEPVDDPREVEAVAQRGRRWRRGGDGREIEDREGDHSIEVDIPERRANRFHCGARSWHPCAMGRLGILALLALSLIHISEPTRLLS